MEISTIEFHFASALSINIYEIIKHNVHKLREIK